MPKTKTEARPARPTSTVTPLWTAEDVSAFLAGRITVKTLMNWRCSGYGPPYVKIGTTILYRPLAVEAWAENQERLNDGAAA